MIIFIAKEGIMDHKIELKDGRKIGIAEYGDPNGMPIFYFHGFPGSRLEASRFHDVAVSNHYRLIAIDRPGMGLSSIDKKRSILSWPKDVVCVANSLGIDKFSVIGHSGGGAFVAACAYVIPQKLNGATIVSGMAPFGKFESWEGMAREQKIVSKSIIVMPWLATVMMWITRAMLKKPNKMMEQMVKRLPEVDQHFFRNPDNAKTIINSTLEAFRNGLSGPSQEMILLLNSWGFNLENVTYPVTIWHGTLDSQVPLSHAKIYANSIHGSQLEILENEGHHSLINNHIEEILKSACKPTPSKTLESQ